MWALSHLPLFTSWILFISFVSVFYNLICFYGYVNCLDVMCCPENWDINIFSKDIWTSDPIPLFLSLVLNFGLAMWSADGEGKPPDLCQPWKKDRGLWCLLGARGKGLWVTNMSCPSLWATGILQWWQRWCNQFCAPFFGRWWRDWLIFWRRLCQKHLLWSCQNYFSFKQLILPKQYSWFSSPQSVIDGPSFCQISLCLLSRLLWGCSNDVSYLKMS